ncbi:MAG TPA: hypothetical protein VGZ23_11835 [bacterium]|nr:hypothetical protein [bacterium]
MTLVGWHGSSLFLGLTLAGDALCLALAIFGELTGRHRMPHLFWWILWLAQVPLAIVAVAGIALFAGGARPRTPLHFLYDGLIVLTLLALYLLRPGGALRAAIVTDERAYRESRWMLLLVLFLGGLVGRAYMTGSLGR